MVTSIVYAMLLIFTIEKFNFSIKNIPKKLLIINVYFIYLSSLSKIVGEEESSLALEISVFMIFLKDIHYRK